MSMFEKINDVRMHLCHPITFMTISGWYGLITVVKLLSAFQFSVLLSPSAFKDAWFANFWGVYGPLIRTGCSQDVSPLINQARGVVLDIGPGNGEWLALFDKTKVTKIYGVEPNADHHVALRQKIKEAGLADIYEIVPVGIQDVGPFLEAEKGGVDSVVTIHCLCSIKQPREMIGTLYGYLAKGGSWIVFEHVVMKQGGVIAWYQSTIDIFWPHFLGGCSITRDTEKWLREAGDWSKFDLKHPENEPSYHVLPHALGVLVK